MIGPAGYRSCLARAQGRAGPSDEDLLVMRRAAWRTHDWTRQTLINEAQPAVRLAAGRRAVSARPAARSAPPEATQGARVGQLEEVREKDPDGRTWVHHRTVDTLGKMLRAGTITSEMDDRARTSRPRSSSPSSTRSGRCQFCACPEPGASRI